MILWETLKISKTKLQIFLTWKIREKNIVKMEWCAVSIYLSEFYMPFNIPMKLNKDNFY
jgi:hypothetical protein